MIRPGPISQGSPAAGVPSPRPGGQAVKELTDSTRQTGAIELAALQKYCGFYEPFTSASNQWQKLRPGYQRKVYQDGSTKGRWIYRPPTLQLDDKRRPLSEIAANVDTRPLKELREQVSNALNQILCRAHCGDKQAIAEAVLVALRAVFSLDHLARSEPDRLRAEAEKRPNWPVMLSLNPQAIKHAKQDLKSLAVGTKAPTPTRPSQRLDPRSFWTRLAKAAFDACLDASLLVPELEAHCRGAKQERWTNKCWGITLKATRYTLSGGSVVMIADWQKASVNLSQPITPANFREWWDVVRSCVLEHWRNSQGSYAEALKLIGQAGEKESRRRHFAFDRVKQALRSLTGVQ